MGGLPAIPSTELASAKEQATADKRTSAVDKRTSEMDAMVSVSGKAEKLRIELYSYKSHWRVPHAYRFDCNPNFLN